MAKEPRPIPGSVVAITGAGRGIGRATARALVGEGARVAIGDVDFEAAGAVAAELGERAVALALDVTDRDSFASFLEATEERLGPLDVLVNNAGIMPLGLFVEESEATTLRQMDINVHGVIHGMKLAMPGMSARRRGHIVNIASGAGKAGYAGGATYCATKHAVVGLSEAVRAELAFLDIPIELSVVMPGVVRTELASGLSDTRGVKVVDPEDVAAAIVEAVRLPRFEVWVPGSMGPVSRVMAVLPRRAREAVARALRADKVLLDVDSHGRAAYERRAAGSTSPRTAQDGVARPATPAESSRAVPVAAGRDDH